MESEAISALLGKYRSFMPALALILEAFNCASQDTDIKVVKSDSATNGMILADFFEAHARKIYAGSLRPDLGAAEALAKKIKKGEIVDGATIRDIRRNNWTLLKDDFQINAGLSVLEDCEWLRLETMYKPQGGRYELIRLNPKLRVRGKL